MYNDLYLMCYELYLITDELYLSSRTFLFIKRTLCCKIIGCNNLDVIIFSIFRHKGKQPTNLGHGIKRDPKIITKRKL